MISRSRSPAIRQMAHQLIITALAERLAARATLVQTTVIAHRNVYYYLYKSYLNCWEWMDIVVMQTRTNPHLGWKWVTYISRTLNVIFACSQKLLAINQAEIKKITVAQNTLVLTNYYFLQWRANRYLFKKNTKGKKNQNKLVTLYHI